MNKRFFETEDGAVTVDWVVLTAAIVGLGLATMAVVSSGVEDLSSDIDTQLQSDHIISTTFRYGPFVYTGRGTSGDYADVIANKANYSDTHIENFLTNSLVLTDGWNATLDEMDYHGDNLDYYVAMYEIAQERELDVIDGLPTPETLDAEFMVAYQAFVDQGNSDYLNE